MHNSSFSQWPVFAEDEREAALRPLLSGRVNYWTGQEGRAFEAEYAAYVGRQYGIAVANGTLALELALAALEIGPGDEVVTTCRTFIASASAITVRGARPVLCDVDTVSQNMTAETIRAVCTDRTKAVICVHLAGWPCDMDPILELAKDKGLWVIEDCAQAHGAGYKGRPVGSLGHMGAFSFCQDKIMSTGGEGGMLVLDDETLWRRAWSYKDHGKSWAAVYEREHAPGFRWLHETFGTNWRMTEMQAAIGRVQLGKLSDWVLRRRQLAARLTETFQELPGLRVTVPGDNIYHAYYKYYVFVRPEKLGTGWDRDRIISEVTSRGVPCMSGICPEIYLEQAFEAHGAWSTEHGEEVRGQRSEVRGQKSEISLRPGEACDPEGDQKTEDKGPRSKGPGEEGRLPVARELGKTSLMFLVHPTLTDAEIAKTCQMMSEVMSEAVY
ncbi:MAG: DegT/DnrJ/EryC1/StrS family aminotransferase [Thermodesulfobacteriota bacterium]